MASKSSKTDPARVTLEEFSRDIERRRAAAGNPELPRNSGVRRTESKRSLLRAIKDAGGEW